MEFISRRPAAPLDTWIESIWLCRAGERSGAERRSSQPRALERVLPSGTAQLIVNLAEDETRVYDESASGLVCQRCVAQAAQAGPHTGSLHAMNTRGASESGDTISSTRTSL